MIKKGGINEMIPPVFELYKSYRCLANNLPISPIKKTGLVPRIIQSQSLDERGTTLNISPPNVTIKYCPTRMITNDITKPDIVSFLNSPAKADL